MFKHKGSSFSDNKKCLSPIVLEIMVIPAVINELCRFKLLWKTLLLKQKKNTRLDFGCHSRNPKLSKSPSPTPTACKIPNRPNKKSPRSHKKSHPHSPAQHDWDCDATPKRKRAQDPQIVNTRPHPNSPTLDQNTQRQTDALGPVTPIAPPPSYSQI